VTASADELARLAGKYDTLAALRRARARGEPLPPASVFRALARAFPGSLNELDTLPLEVIDARAEALRRAAAGGEREPWMEWLSGYHALLRAALLVKPRVAARARPGPDDATAEEIAREVSERLAREAPGAALVPIDASLVREVADPPGGRLVTLVFSRLERLHGRPAEMIKRAIFPRSKR